VCIEPDTGYAWVAGRTGIYRLDTDGNPVFAHKRQTETDKKVSMIAK
jgi:hypothetical protein